MKTMMTFALAAVLGTSSFANNSDEMISNLTSVKTKEKKVQVNLKEGTGKVKIQILDIDGKRLYQRQVTANENILVPFDLTAMPEGKYQVAVISKEDPSNRSIYEIELEEPKIEDTPLQAYSKKIDESSFKLTLDGLERNRTTIQLFDEKGRLVHSEMIKAEESVSRVYHLKKLPLDNLSVIVRDSKDRVASYYF